MGGRMQLGRWAVERTKLGAHVRPYPNKSPHSAQMGHQASQFSAYMQVRDTLKIAGLVSVDKYTKL